MRPWTGRVLAGDASTLLRDTAMHLLVYRERPDVGAVVHAHPAIGHRLCHLPPPPGPALSDRNH
ncbi:MAG: class II aldolase/adducin family protein [Lawsonibacter sp.]